MGIDDFTILRVNDIPHMIKYNNSVPNQESCFGAIHQRKLQAMVWWAKDHPSCGLEINTAEWTATEMKIPIAQINIESTLGGDIKVLHPGKVETGHKWTT